MAPKLTAEERKRIVSLLQEGMSQSGVAKEVKRSKDTVGRIGREAGIESDGRSTKKATEAARDYAKAERLQLLNKGFDKAGDLLKSIKEAKELQAWMVAVATGIDKRRLEDGEVTDRSERHSHDHSGDLEKYFKDLDAFREINGEADSGEPLDTPGTNGKTA